MADPSATVIVPEYGTDRRKEPRRLFVAAGIVIALLAVTVRFHGLSYRDFWYDESCTFIYVHHLFDWPEESNLVTESTNLPYYALLRGWTLVLGDTEWAYRAMSALSGSLTIGVLALMAYRVGGSITAIVCALFAAIHPLHVHYSHEARAYALWVLALSASLALLIEAVRRGKIRWWILYGVALALSLYLHYFTIFIVPCYVIVVLIADRPRRAFRRWLVVTLLAGLVFLPYFLKAVSAAAQGGGSAWIAARQEPWAVLRSLWALLPSGVYPRHLRGLSLMSPDTIGHQPGWLVQTSQSVPVVVVVGLLVMIVGRIITRAWARPGRTAIAKQPQEPTPTSRGCVEIERAPSDDAAASKAFPGLVHRHVIAASLTLVPLVLAWAYSSLIRPVYVVGRYDMVAWPGCMLWLSLILTDGAGFVGRRWAGRITVGACLLIASCSAVPIIRMASLQPDPTFHRVRAERLAELAGPNDLVIVFSYDREYLLYYLHRSGFEGRVVGFPSWLDGQIGWVDTGADLRALRTDRFRSDVLGRCKLIEDTLARDARVWLLADSMDPHGTGARGPINRPLIEALIDRGLQPRWVDNPLMIAAVKTAHTFP